MPELGTGVINLKRTGLPCRKNCGYVAHPAEDVSRAALLTAIAERDDHEKFAHGYIHQVIPTAAWTPFPRPVAGTKTAQPKRGGAR